METPEFKARQEELRARFKSEEAARLKWEADNPISPFQLGASAAANDDEREPPEDMSEADAAEWLRGWDEEQPDGGE